MFRTLTRRLTRTVIIAAAAAGLVATSGAVASAAPAKKFPQTVTITHEAVGPTLVQGEGLGAVRTFSFPTKVNGKASPGSRMVGTLRTVEVDAADGSETRTSDLVFFVRGLKNQLVVGGASNYPAASAVLQVGDPTIRPIVGGSGSYAGARGYVESVNKGDAGWVHTFHFSTR